MDDTALVDCFVIAAETSNEVINLINTLKTDSRLNVIRLNAVMLTSTSSEYLELSPKIQATFLSNYGRTALPGEIGCSLSHNIARQYASQNSMGAIVLEEDASVINLKSLVSNSIEFLNSHQKFPSILSFYNNEYKFTDADSNLRSRKWIRILGAPSSTVAYAINQKAANRLTLANTPIQYMADWPISKTKFYLSLRDCVTHPNDPVVSQIGLRTARQVGFSKIDKIKIMFLFHYYLNPGSFTNFRLFFKNLWVPRFLNQVNKLYFRFLFAVRYLK